jgi:hypothetical protein
MLFFQNSRQGVVNHASPPALNHHANLSQAMVKGLRLKASIVKLLTSWQMKP